MATFEVIDISVHNTRQGRIDYSTVKAAGISGVMMRAGWAGYDGGLQADSGLDENIQRAASAGLGVGLYVYTYAKTVQAAKLAAAQVCAVAQRHPGKITFPIAYDVEEQQDNCLLAQGKEGLTDNVKAFLGEVERQGYYAMWYTGTAFARQYLNMQRLAQYDLWVADYRGQTKLDAQLGHEYGMWQYAGNTGSCPGVTGSCDRNLAYRDFPAIIKRAGLNGLNK